MILSLLLQAAAAQAAPDIVVTGRALPDAAGDAAYDVVVIDRARLAGVASGRLEDVLRDAAGFQQFRRSDARSAHPTSQGATLRGLGGTASSRALVLLDGVPQVDPFGGWISFAAFDPIRLARIRVVRGGGSGVAGPGALAGTIELESAGPAELDGIAGALAYGSRDSLDTDAAVGARLGDGYASLSAGYQRGDGFVPIVARARGPVDRPAAYEQASLAARALLPVAADYELQASGLALYDRRERGVPFTGNRNRGADASLRLVGRGRWGMEALVYAQVRGFDSDFASVNASRSTATQTLDQYNVPATGFGGKLEIRPPLGDGLTLRLGADTRRTAGSTRERFTFVAGSPTRIRRAGGVTDTLGGYAELSWQATPRLVLTGGGRLDRWRIRDGLLAERTLATGAILADQSFPDRRGTEPTARGGLAWEAAEMLSLRAAAYLGWRLPTLNELYRPFRAGQDAVAANSALAPERLRGVDLGVDLRPARGVRLGATLFDNRLENAVANVTLAAGPGTFPQVGFVGAGGAYRMRQNVDAMHSRGVELDGEARLGRWGLTAAYAFADARVRASGPALALDGLRPAQVPRHQGSATLGWGPAGVDLSATVRYVAPQYEDDQNGRRLADAVTLDLFGRVPLAPRLSLELRAENVTDSLVEATISGADLVERATPRTLWAGLRYGL